MITLQNSSFARRGPESAVSQASHLLHDPELLAELICPSPLIAPSSCFSPFPLESHFHVDE
jgi:hypothetical protein